MLIPVGQFNQEFMCVEKLENGKIRKQKIADVIYVPLTDPEVQLR
jgi:protein-L-isoaspartate O-methyltransferase